MKTLILYKSRHGTTRKVVEYLHRHLPGEVDIRALMHGRENVQLDDYDRVIIGGSIHMGRLQKDLSEFVRLREQELLKKPLGLFICCMLKEKAKEQFEMAFSEELRNHATAKGIMGGELLLDKMNHIDKFIARLVAGAKTNVHELNFTAMEEFLSDFVTGEEKLNTDKTDEVYVELGW